MSDTANREQAETMSVVALEDVTSAAAALGLRCKVSIAESVLREVSAETVLEQLRHVLENTAADPAFDHLRAVAFNGEHPNLPAAPPAFREGLRNFAARVRAGVGGISETGTMLAMTVESHGSAKMIVCQLGFGLVRPRTNPAVTITFAEDASYHVEHIANRGQP